MVNRDKNVDLPSVLNAPFIKSDLINKDYVLNSHSAVYSVVTRKSNSIAQLPIKLYMKTNEGRKTVDDYRADLVSLRPQHNRSAFIFWRTVVAMREIYGNAYVFINRDILGNIIELNLLHPTQITPFESVEDNNELYYKFQSKNGCYVIHHLDMLHFTSIYSEGYKGVSFIECLSNVLNLQKTTFETAKSQADNCLKVSGVVKLAANLSKEKKEEYRKQFQDMYSNGWNSVLVLDLGAEYQSLKFDVQDLKLLDNNKITIQQISMVSMIPTYMLGIMDGAKYNNVEQQNLDFVQNCIQPDVIQIEQELNYKLLSDLERSKGMYFKFNLSALLRADMNSRADYYTKLIMIGGITVNEIRELEERPRIGNIGDRPLITLNTTFLDTLEDHERLIKNGGEKDG